MNDLPRNIDSALRRPRVENDGTGAPKAAGDARQDVPLITQYWAILFRWKWAVIGAVAAALATAIIITLLTTPQYQAAVTVEISRDDAQIVDIEGVEPRSGAADQEFYETQYGLLRSRSLAESVARDLNLVTDVRFFEMYGEELEQAPAAGRRSGALSVATREQRLRTATTILLENLEIKPARLSRLVEIRFTSPDNLFAARVANKWAENYIKSNLERRFDAASYARDFLEERLNETRARLEESERRLVAYASRQQIINVGSGSENGDGGGGQRSLASDDVTAINAELAAAIADRVRAQSQLSSAGSGALPQALSSPTISNLRQLRAEVGAEYSKLLAQFEPEYPPVEALKSQMDALDRSLAQEQARIRDSLAQQYREAVNRENTLRNRVEQLKSNLLDLRRRSIQYNIYQRDVDTNRTLYDGLLQRYKEIGVAGGVGTNNIAIIDRAEIPLVPSKPRPLLNIILALIAGLGLGALLAVILEQIDEGITDPQDLEGVIGVPLLGTSPLVKSGDVLETLADRKSDISEAYSSVRTNLNFSTADGVPKTLMITSTRPAEGKTTSSYALALSLARLGRRVLLVDADMRSPTVHRFLSLPNDKGLSTVLSGNAKQEEVVQTYGELSILTAGPHPPNAAELLSSSRLEEFLAIAARDFEHVVIDSPPVMGLADAPLLASKTDAAVFAIQSHGTRARYAKVALDRLRQSQANVLGAILTKFDVARSPFGYGYDYGYGYGRDTDAARGADATA